MPKWKGTVTVVALSTSNNRTGALNPGKYYVWADVNWFMKQGGSTVVAAVTSGAGSSASHTLMAYEKRLVDIASTDATEQYVAGILSSGTGLMHVEPVEGAV